VWWGFNADEVLAKLFFGEECARAFYFFGGLPVDKTLVVFFILICYHLNVYANERYSKN